MLNEFTLADFAQTTTLPFSWESAVPSYSSSEVKKFEQLQTSFRDICVILRTFFFLMFIFYCVHVTATASDLNQEDDAFSAPITG